MHEAGGQRACRVLVVEDEPLVALDLEMMLQRAGFTVVGPASDTDSALRLLEQAGVEAAILDISLGGSYSFALADALADRQIPFLFVSGHAPDILPERHRGRGLVQKPYTWKRLIEGVCDLTAARAT